MLPSHEDANLPEDGCQGITSTVRGSVSPTGYRELPHTSKTWRHSQGGEDNQRSDGAYCQGTPGRHGEAETSGECHGGRVQVG